MKIPAKILNRPIESNLRYICIGLLMIILQPIFHPSVKANPIQATNSVLKKDTLGLTIQQLLNEGQVASMLHFPQSVKRFYSFCPAGAAWIKNDEKIKPVTDALLLLDCVRQYGLKKENYHPKELNYSLLHDVLSQEHLASTQQKARFDIMLTDAMLSIINHLHYGEFNAVLTPQLLDQGKLGDLRAEVFLEQALQSTAVMEAILAAQPKNKCYADLQNYMRLLTGQYICDSYEVPEKAIQQIAINMERLRWINWTSDTFVHINIPTFTLTYQQPDTSYEFKVVVGREKTPTPVLQSNINSIETAPDWKVPQAIFVKELIPKALKDSNYFDQNHMAVYDRREHLLKIQKSTLAQLKLHPEQYHVKQSPGCDNALGKVVFRFTNSFDIYLHDSPEPQLFKNNNRLFSHGCIRVENAGLLAALLLKADGQAAMKKNLEAAMNAYTKKIFSLKKPVPIVITYLTCTLKDGLLQYNDDVYKLDQELMAKMYGKTNQLTQN